MKYLMYGVLLGMWNLAAASKLTASSRATGGTMPLISFEKCRLKCIYLVFVAERGPRALVLIFLCFAAEDFPSPEIGYVAEWKKSDLSQGSLH